MPGTPANEGCQLLIGNLSGETGWRNLKDCWLHSMVAEVVFVRVSLSFTVQFGQFSIITSSAENIPGIIYVHREHTRG